MKRPAASGSAGPAERSRRRRILLWLMLPSLVLVVLLAGLVVLSHIVPLNPLRPIAQAQLSSALNRPVSLSGDLWIRIGAHVRFVAKKIEIRNPDGSGFPDPAFLTARRVAIDIPFLSLLAGDPTISRAVAAGGDLKFQVRSDGVNNWNLSETTDNRTARSIPLPDVLKVKDGRVSLIDVPANQTSAIDELEIALIPRWAGPDGRQADPGDGAVAGWDLDADARIRGKAVTLTGRHSATTDDGVYDLELTLESGLATAAVKGRVFEAPLKGFDGRVTARIPSVRQLASWLQIPLDPAQPDPGSLALEADLSADGQRLALTTGSLTGDHANGTAHGSLHLDGDTLRLDGAADIAMVDFNVYLPPENVETELPTPIANLAIFQALREIASLPDTAVPLDWLDGLEGGYGLQLEKAVLRGLEVQQAQACLTASGGAARLAIFEDNRERDAPAPEGKAGKGAAADDKAGAAKAGAGASGGGAASDPATGTSAGDTGDRGPCLPKDHPDMQADAPPAATGRLVVTLNRVAPGGSDGGTDGEADGAAAGGAGGANAAAKVRLDGAATAMPIGTFDFLFPAPAGQDGKPGTSPFVHLTADTALSTQGTTWLRLAAGIEGRLQAALSDRAGADAPKPVRVKAEAPGGDAPLTALLQLDGNKDSVDLKVTASPLRRILLDDSFTLNAAMDGGLASGSIDGVVVSRPAPGFHGKAGLKSDRPGRLFALLTGDPSMRRYDPGALALTLSLQDAGTAIEIQEAALSLGPSRFEASGRLVPQEVMQADLTVTGSKVDLERLVPPSAAPTPSANGAAADGGSPALSARALFPQALQLDLVAKLTEVSSADLAFESVDLTGHAGPTRLSLTGSGVPAGGGKAGLDLTLAMAGETARAEASGKLSVEAGHLRRLLRAGKAEGPAGTGSLTLDFTAGGDSLPALAQSLTGTADLKIQELSGVALHPIEDLTASLAAETAKTSLTAKANFPKPKLAADDAIAIVAKQIGEPAVTDNPVTADLRCQAGLWHCLAAGEVPADLSLVSGDSRLDLAGHAALHRRPSQVRGKLTFAGRRLSDWDAMVGDALPQYGPYKLTGDVVLSPRRQQFSDLALTVAKSDFAGRLDMQWRDDRPYLDADLHSKRLSTQDFGSGNVEGQQFAEKVQVPTGWLDWVRGKAKLAVADLEIQHGIAMQDATTSLESDGKVLQIHGFRAGFIAGQLAATGSLRGAQNGAAVLDLSADLKGADLGAVVGRLGEADAISGTLAAVVKARSQGETLDDLVKHPTGDYFVRVDKGHIADSTLGLLSVKLDDLFSPLFGKSTRTDLECLQSHGSARAGEFDVKQVLMDTSIFTMHGDGKLSLPKQTVDMDFRIFGERVSVASLAPAFSVSGQLSDPSISFNPGETALDLAPSLLGSLAGEVVNIVKGVTGGGAKGSVRPCPPPGGASGKGAVKSN